jgi:hypothetical protein
MIIELAEPPSKKALGFDSAGEEGTIIGKRGYLNQTGLMSKKAKKSVEKFAAATIASAAKKTAAIEKSATPKKPPTVTKKG